MYEDRPVLDLSYTDIGALELNGVLPRVRALVLAGNKMLHFYYLRQLPRLELLCCDFCALSSVTGIPDEVVPALRHLLLRGNNIHELGKLPAFSLLETLDLSQNPIVSEQEPYLPVYPSLKTIVFGSAETRLPFNRLSKSCARINVVSAFLRLFCGDVDRLSLADRGLVELGGVGIQAQVHGCTVDFVIVAAPGA